jgi:hypothetical protein
VTGNYLFLLISNWRFPKVPYPKFSYISRRCIPGTYEAHSRLHHPNVDKYVCGKLQYFYWYLIKIIIGSNECDISEIHVWRMSPETGIMLQG